MSILDSRVHTLKMFSTEVGILCVKLSPCVSGKWSNQKKFPQIKIYLYETPLSGKTEISVAQKFEKKINKQRCTLF
jgi:hypothetical protein